MEAVGLICDFATKKKTNFIDDSIYDTIQEIAPDLSDVVSWCTWKLENFCIFSLSLIMTAEGLCFAFNALNFHEIYTKE